MKKHNLIKTSLITGTILLAGSSFAQKKNETSAAVAYKNTFSMAMQSGDMTAAKKALLDAKKYIDIAMENPETKESPKTLWLKGAIYCSFIQVGMSTGDSTFLKNLNEDGLDQAIAAFKKGYEVSDKFDSDIKESVFQNHSMMENFSMAMYKSENYKEAAEMYTMQAQLLEAVAILDSNSLFNAALCYDRSSNFGEAAKKYEQLAKAGYKDATTYALASNAYRRNNQNEDAKRIVEEGRAKYPQNKELLLEAVNTRLEAKDAVGAEELLTQAIAADPTNKLLHLTIGSIYIDLKEYVKAEKSINEALKIDPEYEDALYQLGAHLVTWGGEVIAKTNDMKYNDPNVKVLEKESKEIYTRAISPLEKYITKKPNDGSVLLILSQLYRNLGDMEKSAEFKKRADAAK